MDAPALEEPKALPLPDRGGGELCPYWCNARDCEMEHGCACAILRVQREAQALAEIDDS